MAKLSLRIEPANLSQFGSSDGTWCTVWGHVFANEQPHAVYYARWNDTALGEAEFVVSVGPWGQDSEPAARSCVALLGRTHQGRLSFMLVDAEDSSFSDQVLLGLMRAAADVRGTELATTVFCILDEVVIHDARVTAMRARLEA